LPGARFRLVGAEGSIVIGRENPVQHFCRVPETAIGLTIPIRPLTISRVPYGNLLSRPGIFSTIYNQNTPLWGNLQTATPLQMF